MGKEMKEVICKKCGNMMERRNELSDKKPRTVISSSVTSSVTTTSGYYSQFQNEEEKIIEISEYVCPKCGEEKQIID